MAMFRRKKTSYYILGRELASVDNGRPKYRRVASVVRGETFNFEGHCLGIHRREHRGDTSRKWDYVLTDIATGRRIAVNARKLYIIEALEQKTEAWVSGYLRATGYHLYQGFVNDFTKLVGGSKDADVPL